MRIVAGSARGRALKGPPSTATRPTSDRVREAIFNILTAIPVPFLEDGRVLDLYAGTGAMGLEALSRGAGSADFVDADAACCQIIRANARLCGMDSRVTVRQERVERWMTHSTASHSYVVIFLDPPYRMDELDGVFSACEHLLAPGGWVVLEHHRRVATAHDRGTLRFWKSRSYGDSAVSLWQKPQEENGVIGDPRTLPG